MRKITYEALTAFEKGKKFKKGNTQVRVCGPTEKPERIELLLHDNVIAYNECVYPKHTVPSSFGDRYYFKKLWVTSAGWQTNTTKERLNAFNGVNIQQKDFQWYLNGEAWDGEPKYIASYMDYF